MATLSSFLQCFEFQTYSMWWALRKDNVWRFQERDRLSTFAENELRVGLSMGSKSIDEVPGARPSERVRRK
eukprot:6535150-Karenia_brevis.AAC.1